MLAYTGGLTSSATGSDPVTKRSVPLAPCRRARASTWAFGGKKPEPRARGTRTQCGRPKGGPRVAPESDGQATRA